MDPGFLEIIGNNYVTLTVFVLAEEFLSLFGPYPTLMEYNLLSNYFLLHSQTPPFHHHPYTFFTICDGQFYVSALLGYRLQLFKQTLSQMLLWRYL